MRTCIDCPREISGPANKVRCASCAHDRRRIVSSDWNCKHKKKGKRVPGRKDFHAWWTGIQKQRKRGDLAGLLSDGTYNLTPWCEAGAPTPGDQQEGLKTVRLPRPSTGNELPAELRQGRPTVYLSNL